MITAEDFVLELNDDKESKNFKLGTVVDLFVNKTAKVKFDGEDIPSEKQYAYLKSYMPVVEDRVLLAVTGGTYIILGKVNFNVSPDEEEVPEEIDRFSFDQIVKMYAGLTVSGLATFNNGMSVTGNIGVNGNVTATGVSATGAMTAASLYTPGTLGAGDTTLSKLQVNGSISGNSLSISQGATFYGSTQFRSSIGFFMGSPRSKISVSKYSWGSGGPTLNGLTEKVNELIDALRGYNLI